MTRRGFFGWLMAAVAWWKVGKASDIPLPRPTVKDIEDLPKVNTDKARTIYYDYHVPVLTRTADGRWSYRSEVRTGTFTR